MVDSEKKKMNCGELVIGTICENDGSSVKELGLKERVACCVLTFKMAYDHDIIIKVLRSLQDEGIVIVLDRLDVGTTMVRERKDLRKIIRR